MPGDLQKALIEFRLGTVVVLLDENYETLIRELAQELPQGRNGHAVVWKNRDWKSSDAALPENLFVRSTIDRQDLIGKGRLQRNLIIFFFFAYYYYKFLIRLSIIIFSLGNLYFH